MSIQLGKETKRHVPCAHCGQMLEPLRAARVRFSAEKYCFFCCKEHSDLFAFANLSSSSRPGEESGSSISETEASAKVPSEHAAPLEAKELLVPPRKQAPLLPPRKELAQTPVSDQSETPENFGLHDEISGENLLPQLGQGIVSSSPELLNVEIQEREVRDSLLPTFGEARDDGDQLRVMPFEQHRAWIPVGLSAVAGGLSFTNGEDVWPTVASTIILASSVAWGHASLKAWDKSARGRSKKLEERLNQSARRVTPTGVEIVHPNELRPGEEILVRSGEWITADGTLSGGNAQVRLWEGSAEDVQVESGSRLTAGGQVRTGECTITCSKTGKERAFDPLVSRDPPRLEHQIFSSRLARMLSGPLAPLAAAAATGLVWFEAGSYATMLSVFGAVWGSLSHPVARSLPSVMGRKWLMRAARHGISFAHGQLIDLGGHVTAAIFCARGTVLHGQPEIAEVHPLRDADENEILSLSAGAESVIHHPVAAAVLRAAEVRKVSVDTCRSHNAYPGSGVVCVSSKGDLIVLGSRELLLRERISIAMAEETLRNLESRGLSSLLLAKNNHLVGVLALQDSLRAGAKASIQLLLDEGIEPVLLSGDSRTTTEAVAHALAVEHVRPEIAAGRRAAEVQSLIDAGSLVAVIGTSPRDDAALGAAPVPIVLEGASVRFRDTEKRHERCIGLVGDQVLTAPLALLICRRIRQSGTLAWTIAFLPALLGGASVASQLVPVYVAPLLAASGAVLAAWLCLRSGPQVRALRPEQSL